MHNHTAAKKFGTKDVATGPQTTKFWLLTPKGDSVGCAPHLLQTGPRGWVHRGASRIPPRIALNSGDGAAAWPAARPLRGSAATTGLGSLTSSHTARRGWEVAHAYSAERPAANQLNRYL